MTMDEYLADADGPSLSSGIAHLLVSRSPLHAWHAHPRLNPHYTPDESDEFDYGTAAHAMLLEGDDSRIAVVDAKDWRTKAAQEARAAAREAGKTPMLERQLSKLRRMVKAAQEAIDASEVAEAWHAAKSEQVIKWEERGVKCKARADRLSNDRRYTFDYKTCASAHPDAFLRNALSCGYDIQEAFYRRGVQAAHNALTDFIFVAQEKDAPYACSLVAFDPAMREMADKRVEYAIGLWKECLSKNQWPGYPNRVAWVLPPSWYMAEHEVTLQKLEEYAST